MRRYIALAMTLLVVPLVLFGCDKELPAVSSPVELVGQALPKVRIQRIDVGPTDLKTNRGRPALVALWASWCTPCAEEIPALLRWHATRQDVDLIVLNVDSVDTDLNVIRRIAGDLGLGAPLLATSPARASALGLRSLPLSLAVDADGVVVAVSEGYRGEDAMREWLTANLPEAP